MNENTNISADALEELNGRYLAFYIGERLYGVPLVLVLEIIQIQKITFLPSIPSHVKGIVNLRGKVVPVIDVRLKFGLEERPHDDKTCIVVLDIRDMHIGLIVDSVYEVVTANSSKMTDPPKIGDPSTRFLSSITEIGDNVMLNVDFDKFFQDDIDFLQFSEDSRA